MLLFSSGNENLHIELVSIYLIYGKGIYLSIHENLLFTKDFTRDGITAMVRPFHEYDCRGSQIID